MLVVCAKTRFPYAAPAVAIERGREIARMLEEVPLRERPEIAAVLVYDVATLPPTSSMYADLGSLRIGRDAAPTGFARFSVLTCNSAATVPFRTSEIERLVGPNQTW